MEYIKKASCEPTNWLLLGIIICLIVLVLYGGNIETLDNTSSENKIAPNSTLPTIPAIDVNFDKLPISEEVLRQAIKEVYKADISSIKNLSDITKALQKGRGIQIPGKLVINGETNLSNTLKVSEKTNLMGNVNVTGKTNLIGELLINTAPGNVPFMQGIIVMWSGAEKNIPAGWVLCDGTNNTPDLRGRFILASGTGEKLTAREVNQKGGNETHTLTINEIPSHQHSVNGTSGCIGYTASYNGKCEATYPLQSTNTGSTGGGAPHSIMPPFYVLAYIMKL